MGDDTKSDPFVRPPLDMWRYSPSYNIRQAAALIAGCEPADLERYWPGGLEDGPSLGRQVQWRHEKSEFAAAFPEVYAAREMLVHAIRQGELRARVVSEGYYEHYCLITGEDGGEWKVVEPISETGTLIERDELLRWLRLREIEADFFSSSTSEPHPQNGQRQWPWGAYTTKGLEILADAVRLFWADFDPEAPDDAPTNEQVIEYLTRRGMSERVAQAVASLIRHEKAPVGRRPKGS